MRFLHAPDRFQPLPQRESAASNGSQRGKNIVFKYPLSARLERSGGNILIGQVEVADTNNVHVIMSAKQAEYTTDASIHIKELVKSVSFVVAIADSYATSVTYAFHQ